MEKGSWWTAPTASFRTGRFFSGNDGKVGRSGEFREARQPRRANDIMGNDRNSRSARPAVENGGGRRSAKIRALSAPRHSRTHARPGSAARGAPDRMPGGDGRRLSPARRVRGKHAAGGRFGLWNAAVEAAGLGVTRRWKVPNDVMLKNLADVGARSAASQPSPKSPRAGASRNSPAAPTGAASARGTARCAPSRPSSGRAASVPSLSRTSRRRGPARRARWAGAFGPPC